MISDDDIRQCVFMELDERFDPHLAQAESLTILFLAMHDGVCHISEEEGKGGGLHDGVCHISINYGKRGGIV